MSSIALKLLKDRALSRLGKEKRNKNSDDILYEWAPDERSGKLKKRKRGIPVELSDKDKQILKKVRKKAYRYDQGFSLCGFRFGISPVIGLLPVVGDGIEVLLSLNLIRAAAKVDGGLPKKLYSMMVFNIFLDFLAGFVPILGDMVDFMFRANTRNAWLIDAYLMEKAEALKEGVIRDPYDEKKGVAVPSELRGDDVEQGVGAARAVQAASATPAAVPPARTQPSNANTAPDLRTGPPGRNLTGQGKPGVRHVEGSRRDRSRR